MDIYEYLKMDHQHVSQLFKQFDSAERVERKRQIMALIAQELLVHAHSEQETFYEFLKQFEQTRDTAMHGLQEHKEIEEQIALILHSNEHGAQWIKQVKELNELIDHHVNEEEGEVFKQAKKVLSAEDAYVIKEKMHYLKQRMLLALKKQVAAEAK